MAGVTLGDLGRSPQPKLFCDSIDLVSQGDPLGKWDKAPPECLQLDETEEKGSKEAQNGPLSAHSSGNASWVETPGPACTCSQRGGGGSRQPTEVPMELWWQYQFRVIMLGDSTVGKSSLLRRYTEGIFLDAVNQTVGVDFYVQFVELEPGLQVKLQFWDTAGQERFRWVQVVGCVGEGDGAKCPPVFGVWVGCCDLNPREFLGTGVCVCPHPMGEDLQ